MAAGAGGMVLLTQVSDTSAYVSHVAPGLVLLGLGIGTVFSCAFSGGTVGVAEDDAGVASATVNTFQQVRNSFGTSLLSTLSASAVSSYLTDHGRARAAVQAAQVHGDTTAFRWSAAILGAGAVGSAVLFRGRAASPVTVAAGDLAAAEVQTGDVADPVGEPMAVR